MDRGHWVKEGTASIIRVSKRKTSRIRGVVNETVGRSMINPRVVLFASFQRFRIEHRRTERERELKLIQKKRNEKKCFVFVFEDTSHRHIAMVLKILIDAHTLSFLSPTVFLVVHHQYQS